MKDIGEEAIARKFDRFRIIRNSINYYGKNISIEECSVNTRDILELIDLLFKKYFPEFYKK
ncbi:MAG: hypothetical protein AABX65_00195 [Nanoarchaeota archaeon]